VDVFVRKLRAKLEKASPSWRYIHTHFGVGYRLSAEWDGEVLLGADVADAVVGEPVSGGPAVPDAVAATLPV
jgi:hypothetical protein